MNTTAPTFSLATEQWIPVLTPDGYRDVSLMEVFTQPDIIDVTSSDVLADAAIRRLLLACAIAGKHANETPTQWVCRHAEDFDILHPTRPFAQNARLAGVPLAKRPEITTQLYDFTAGTGSSGDYTVTNPWLEGATLTLPEAARLLLVRHMFSAGGLGAQLEKYIGVTRKEDEKGVSSYLKSLHFNTPFAWVVRPTLAQSLATMLEHTTVRTTDLGKFHFTFPDAPIPGTEITKFGVLDVLTWPSRSLHLTISNTATGPVATHLTVFEGHRLPRLDKNTPIRTRNKYGRVFRHTLWWSLRTTKPASPRGVRTEDFMRSDWQHLLECYRTEDNPSLVSPEQPLPQDAELLITAVAGDKSRIDNIVNWRLPAPHMTRENINALMPAPGIKTEDDTSLFGHYRRSGYRLAAFAARQAGLSAEDGPTRMAARHAPLFDQLTRPVILDALATTITLEQAREKLAAVHRRKQEVFASDLAGKDPLAAAQIIALKTPDWANPRTT